MYVIKGIRDKIHNHRLVKEYIFKRYIGLFIVRKCMTC